MKIKLFIFYAACFMNNYTVAQLPDTDIFLSKIKKEKNTYSFSKPENITQRAGYDNQPSFTEDGKKILFISVRDTLQSDVYSYDIKKRSIERITSTPESEYSPAFTPNGKFLSVVRVDADSGQRFYKLPEKDFGKPEVVKNTDSIGYACWVNDSTLAMFILGPSYSLQLLNTKTSERKLIASDIGRCMKMSADRKKMIFVLKANDTEWYLYSMDAHSHMLTRISRTLEGSEDFAVLPDDSILMGKESKLYILDSSGNWKVLADFSDDLPGFYRIAVNQSGSLLALVAYIGKKP